MAFTPFADDSRLRNGSGVCESEHHPGRTPDRRTICRVFDGFRCRFCRQMRDLSTFRSAVLGVRPTEERSVGYL